MTTVQRPLFFKGEFRELVCLFFPILVITFFGNFSLFVEKLLFARLSAETLEVAINASIVSQIFRFPCFYLAMIAQVWVGRWHGANELKAIGPGIWQFIWFSFLSMLITFPLSLVYGSYYFRGTPNEGMVMPYYFFLVSINFIYPLGATLTCLYLGQGKTRLILWSTIGFQLLKLILAYLLILGWGLIPSLGLIGGALSTLISQGGYCCVLLVIFLNPKLAKIYDSWAWRFRPKLFWDYIYPGLLRALGSILIFTCWASIARLMIAKGSEYNLVFSIGSTLYVFLLFLGDGICQAQTTVISQILGMREYHLMNKAFRSGVLLVLMIIAVFGIPLVLFPTITFHYLFPKIVISDVMISKVLLGVWISFAIYTFYYVPISYILAFKDTKFSLFMGCLNWIDGYLLIYVAIEILNIAADQFWLVLSLMHLSIAVLYCWRMRWLKSKVLSIPSQASNVI
jgi:multidrug resistance protein, MATE family